MLEYDGKERELFGGEAPTTNNRMELTAVIEALNALKRPSRVVLHTDSQYVQKGITEWLRGWKARGWRTAAKEPVKNADLWVRLDEAAIAVHGITREQLAGKPRFAEIADELLEHIRGAELVIHNAPFDVGFLDAELARAGRAERIGALCAVLDTLELARKLHPGQRNSLDALCKRYGIDNSHRELHGALLDARILADVYLAMTGGQSTLALDEEPRREGARHMVAAGSVVGLPLVVVAASAAERAAHEQLQELLQKESRGHCLWRNP